MMLVALGTELTLLLLILLAYSWFRNRASSRRDSEAIRALIKRIKDASTEREKEVDRFLGQQMGMCGDALEQTKIAILRAQLVLLQRFASVYKKRDAGAAAQFDIDFNAALVPYHALQGSGEGITVEPTAVDTSELEALRAENTRLSDELSVTMETMSRMLNEYSTMFAGGVPVEAAPIASLIGAAAADKVDDDAAEMGMDADPSVPVSADENAADEGPVDAPSYNSDSQGGIEVPFAEADCAASVEEPDLGDGDQLEDIDAVLAEVDSAASVEASDPDGGSQLDDIDVLLAAAENGTDPVENARLDDTADDSVRQGAEGDRSERGGEPTREPVVATPDLSVNAAPEPMAIERGDDLDSVDELLEEGAVEVVTFAETDDLDIELAESEDDLFDSAEPEIIARAEDALEDAADSAEAANIGDGDELFDAGDEPLKTQAGA
jgi:hypothetical protein